MKVCIIGGGAAGLMTASILANKTENLEIVVVEKLEHIGKKLLVTGNGKCNLTNAYIGPSCYNNEFSYNIAKSFDTRAYFLELGLITYISEQGRVYPFSNMANSVLDILRFSLKNVDIKESTIVNKITNENNKYQIITNNGTIEADFVILATGGKTYYKDTNSYTLANMLSHKVSMLTPSLCPIKVKENLASIENLRCKVKATLFENENQIYQDKGEVLFKKDYLSGIVIFQLSSKLDYDLFKSYKVVLDLAPSLSKDYLLSYVDGHKDLMGLFPKMIAQYVLKHSPTNETEDIVNTIKNLSFEVADGFDFKNAQITAGGVSIDEINDNLESKLHKNLYIVGEMLDADGLCGGYNLQFAFASGARAAYDIIDKINIYEDK